jgi:hypothetical protein
LQPLRFHSITRFQTAAHLSERNNRPELVVDLIAETLGCSNEWVGVATPEHGFDWRSLA